MKRIVLVSCFAALAAAQQPRGTNPGDFDITATKIWREGNVTHMSGRVVMNMGGFTMHAAEANFDWDAKEIHVRGDVNIKLK